MSPKKLFGEFFKEKRKEIGLTLRKFCIMYKLDPGNISKIERGLQKPPSNKSKVEEYARYLHIEEGSDDWLEFINRAAACRGELPLDIYEDEELVAKLPLIFRTIQGKKVTPDLLDDLVEIVKKA